MSNWNKKQISKEAVSNLVSKYRMEPLVASIFARRGITDGKDILYFMEDDMRFQHSPFSFTAMEDVVDRILQAQEEKEKVLIYGDRDVDGVTATTILYGCLSSMGIDVSYRLPVGDDAYGLSMSAVDDFAKEYGSLIITVDCGISNNAEIAHASELGMDVIVLDHHNCPTELPSPAIIVDPKLEDSGYPFQDISGAAVVFKTVSAIRFSRSPWYKQEFCLLNAREEDGGTVIECLKIRNLVPVDRRIDTVVPGERGIMDTWIPSYLQGQQILVWDAESVSRILLETFGSGVEFNFMDIRPEVSKIMPRMANLPLSHLKTLSTIAKYGNHEPTEIGGFYNIYVSYVNQCNRRNFPDFVRMEEMDLELVALAALADIMPMQDENRIFVNRALASINSGKIRPGLLELMSKLNLLGKRVTSTDLSWIVVANLNAAGRLGHSDLAAELFLSADSARREQLAREIQDLNLQRKQLCADGMSFCAIQAKASVPLHSDKLCVVVDERINRGVCGIIAGRLVGIYDVPSIVVTVCGENAIGSMRSCRGIKATEFLDGMKDLFISYGGHDAAAGFSMSRENLDTFRNTLVERSAAISLDDSGSSDYSVDAEIPSDYMTPHLLDVEDIFEPFGEMNPQLLFMAKNVPVSDAMVMGKGEKTHLKVIINPGKYKWPCLFWNEGERLHRDFNVGDDVDILFHVERNVFNGMETPQIVLTDIKRSGG